jgi:hypothetical protein
MSDTEFLGGLTYFTAVFAAVLALPITWLLLRRYRRSIFRLMNQRGVVQAGSATHGAMDPAPPRPAFSGVAAAGKIGAGNHRNVMLVVIVGLLFGFAFSILFLAWNDIDFSIYRISFFGIYQTWPTVIGVWIVTGGNKRWVWSSLAVYFVALWATGLIAGAGPMDPARLWVWSLIPTAAIIAFLTRPLRGVGTLVLGTMMVAIVGSQAFAIGIVGSESLLDTWVEFFFAIGITDGNVMFWALQLVGLVGAVILGILVTLWLARWYGSHGFSEQMLLLGTVFLVFAIDFSVGVSSSDGAAFGLGMSIFAGTAVIAMVLYRVIHRTREEAPALLMLRVFSPDPKSQRLLDRINAGWRYLGPVRMIGGPDLAIANVEPNEFLTFVRGKLRRLFIDQPAALAERLRCLTTRPDPDARYRIDEFFCFDDTWRLTVTGLLERCDAVVMDLRAFGPGNQGCIDEIGLLAEREVLDRTVLLVDARTDHALLDSVLGRHGGEGPMVIEVDDDDPHQAVMALAAAATVGPPRLDSSPHVT